MKFEECKFKNKSSVKLDIMNEIYENLAHSLNLDCFSELEIKRYLNILVDCQDFNPDSNTFYDECSGLKLDIEFMSSVAHEYILEHILEFRKQ